MMAKKQTKTAKKAVKPKKKTTAASKAAVKKPAAAKKPVASQTVKPQPAAATAATAPQKPAAKAPEKKCGKCGKTVCLILVVLAILAIICYVVCPKFSDKVSPTLAGTAWHMTEVGGALPAANVEFSLEFSNDGRLAGRSGCNRFGGSYVFNDGRLKVTSPLVSTRMACPTPVMTQENQFHHILSTVEQASVSEDGRLFVWGEGGRVMVFRPAVDKE